MIHYTAIEQPDGRWNVTAGRNLLTTVRTARQVVALCDLRGALVKDRRFEVRWRVRSEKGAAQLREIGQ